MTNFDFDKFIVFMLIRVTASAEQNKLCTS